MSKQLSLKALTRMMVERIGGHGAAIAVLGVNATDVSNWTRDDHPRFIPVDHLVDLNEASGDLFLKELARMRGYDLVPLDRREVPPKLIIERAAEIAEKAGNCVRIGIEAIADGKLCPREKREMRDSLGELLNSAHQYGEALS